MAQLLDTAPGLQTIRRKAVSLRRRMTNRGGFVPGSCLVCGGAKGAFEPIVYAPKPSLERKVAQCRQCGYVQIEELPVNRYRGKQSLDELPSEGTRIGTEDEPGREFKMARMALDILGREGVEVMVYGIGRSMDNHHIAKLHRVTKVAIGDIMKLRDDAEFHDANQPATKKFPIVIASEVVEHFRDPRPDFQKLFQFVAKDGLLVCGTNIYAGGDLTKDRYPFWLDHTSYYTYAALQEVAKANGFFLDFRTPLMAGPHGRKRYVIFTRSFNVLEGVSRYFANHATAPSEEA